MGEPYLAIQVVMMPRDTNPLGSIFGGVILSYVDQAGAIGARREVVRAGGPLPILVTVAVNRVEFKQPVLVGDVVRFLTRPVRLGQPEAADGLPAAYCNPILSTAVGLIPIAFSPSVRLDAARAGSASQGAGYLRRVGQWLREGF